MNTKIFGINMNNKLIKIDHQKKIHKETFTVNWTLGNICNYSCSYCDSVLNDGKTKWIEINNIINFCDQVIKKFKIKDKKEVFFEFTGGEVTFYPELPNLLKYIKKNNCKVGIITNGSRKADYFKKIINLLDHIYLSYHSEYADENDFLNTVNFIYNKISTHIRIMMHPKYFDKCEKIGFKIIKNHPKIPISFSGLLENLYSGNTFVKYSKEQLKRLDELYIFSKDHNNKYGKYPHRGLMTNYYSNGETKIFSPSEYLFKKMNTWKNWLCWAGIEQIVITSQGDVFSAWCCQDWLGNINKTNKYESVNFPKHPTFCLKDICHCGNDITLHRQYFKPI